MAFVFALGMCAFTMRSPPPFILRLYEPPQGMYPSIHEAIVHWAISRNALQTTNCQCTITNSGHVLLTTPLSDTVPRTSPMDLLKREAEFRSGFLRDEVLLVDCMEIFESTTPKFRCFLTCMEERNAYAARIEGTSIWVLLSNFMGLVECNPCKTSIDRREWQEIQKGFLKALNITDYQTSLLSPDI